ncbi:hypothetical protein MNBD_GAMMA16-2199 [hydrothermal vent metagenome]|uniref:Two-component transcriptional response regulator, LuxR family n=1 Tax=hydrothermal vent metagenome TaxID=652676 RepID=A0A3B0Z8V7_9ZZZZ
MKKTTTVLVADDHSLLLAGFVMILQSEKSIKVIGEAKSAEQACLLYSELKPNVTLMDILFQNSMTGFDAIKKILKSDPEAGIIVLSQHDQARIIKESYDVGAKAFIKKNDPPSLLITAIKEVAAGNRYFSPDTALTLASFSTSNNPSPRDILSAREYEIYKAIASDKTIAEIAKEMSISEKSVHNALYQIRQKTGLKRTTQIAKDAQTRGIVK